MVTSSTLAASLLTADPATETDVEPAAATLAAAPAAEPTVEPAPASNTRDPFAALDAPQAEVTIEPLDAAVDMPEGMSFDVWDRLVDARNAKISSEDELKR